MARVMTIILGSFVLGGVLAAVAAMIYRRAIGAAPGQFVEEEFTVFRLGWPILWLATAMLALWVWPRRRESSAAPETKRVLTDDA